LDNVARFDRFGGVGKEIVVRMEKSKDLEGNYKEGEKIVTGEREKSKHFESRRDS